jgi:hypothetical protein
MKLLKSAVALSSFLVAASPAYAVTLTNPVSAKINSLGDIFNIIFTFLIGIVGALAIIFIILGGIRYILARGDPKATEAARGTITAALIGLVIALLAVVIVIVLGNLLGAGGPFTGPAVNQ